MTMVGDVAVPITLADEFVKVRNNSDKVYITCWANKNYAVKPHSEGFVPWACMCQDYGDPRSSVAEFPDELRGGYVPERTYEIRRLMAWYGIGEGFLEGRPPIDWIRERALDVEFSTLAGERIVTVVEDPEGGNTLDVNEGTPNDPRTLKAMIHRQSQQIEYMQNALESMQRGALTTADNIPEDEPGSGLGSPQRARNAAAGLRGQKPPAPPVNDDTEPPDLIGAR